MVLAWSTGKDSAWCLHVLRSQGVEVVGLLTTVTTTFDRVSVHGTRRSVLRAQAAAVGLPVLEVEIPYPCSNQDYEKAMAAACTTLVDSGATHVAFGDLFLQDVREYREERMAGSGLDPLFPLWGRDTKELATEMRDAGLLAYLVSAPEDSRVAPLMGHVWDPEELAALEGVDPCGERGEFHTCVVGAPGMEGIAVEVGPVVRRDGSVFADLETVASE